MFVHIVFFWLKDGTSEAERAQLLHDCETLLQKIPTVRNLWVGAPAMTPRDVVDNTYSVGLTVVLDDSAGHDVYQQHSLHQDFIARNKPNWKRIQVYDYK